MFDWTKLIPAGQVEELARGFGPDLTKMLMRMAAVQYQLQPGERMAFIITEHMENGKPTVVALPMALPPSLSVAEGRKFKYHDLPAFLATAPIAKWIRELKEGMKFDEQITKLREELVKASERGDRDKVMRLVKEVEAMKAKMPSMARMMDELTDRVAASNQQPAAAAAPTAEPPAPAPATEEAAEGHE
ncbi:MAG: hypothetical protein QY325_04275 [Flavobacteriales bacterium]|nr:MAG: hypothetical protein QY325_04275 [Flavobacteriales bacterium]